MVDWEQKNMLKAAEQKMKTADMICQQQIDTQMILGQKCQDTLVMIVEKLISNYTIIPPNQDCNSIIIVSFIAIDY